MNNQVCKKITSCIKCFKTQEREDSQAPSNADMTSEHKQDGDNTLQDKTNTAEDFSNILSKGQAEKSKDEDEALKQKAVTYTQYSDLQDFEGDDHLFVADQAKFF